MFVRLHVCTMLGGEEGGLGARWVFGPRGHQLDRSHVFVGQLPERSLSVLDHLLHRGMLLKRFPYLGLTESEREGHRGQTISRVLSSEKSSCCIDLFLHVTVVATDLQLRCDDSLVLDGQNVGSWAQHGRRPIQEPLNVPQSSLGPVFRLELIYQLIGQQICSVITPSLGLKVENTCISPTVMSLIGLFLFPR